MIFPDRSISDMLNVSQLSRLAEFAHYGASGATLELIRSDTADQPRRFAFRAHVGGVGPGVALWRWDDFQVVSIAGAKHILDQHYAIGGWSHLYPWDRLEGGFNEYSVTWANSVLTFLEAEGFVLSRPSWFAGFSFGGSAATMLAALCRSVQTESVSGAVTFGCPKFCDATALGTIGPATAVRVMNYGDPMPYLCPTIEHAPLMYVGLTISGARAYSQYVHPRNGLQIDSAGNVQPAVLPLGVVVPFDVFMLNFIDANIGEGRPHSIRNYVTNLNGFYAVDDGTKRRLLDRTHGLEPAPVSPVGMPAEPVTPRQVRRIVQSAVSDRAQVPTQPPAFGLARRRARRVRIVRAGATRTVLLDGSAVYSTESGRDARGVARALRMLVTQVNQQPLLWQRGDVVDIIRATDLA